MAKVDAESREQNAEKISQHIKAAFRTKRALQARERLMPFILHTMPDPFEIENDPLASRYKPVIHHEILAEQMEEVVSGKCLRLIISLPPQHGKSEIATRRFIPWFWGKYPHKNIMHGSYSQDFADGFGSEVRNILEQAEYAQVFPKLHLQTGSKAKDHMANEDGGKLSFLGRGGAGTGKPADMFIIDDPIKDAKEAESVTIRNDVWEWFTKVAYTRCHVLSAIIIIQTRWHEDDLVGRLTDPTNPFYNEEVAKTWTVINIPAIIDEPKLAAALGKKVGEALWPERFPLEHLNTARLMNPIGFSALYMGRPTPPEGAFYKREMLLGYEKKDLPTNMRMYGTCDLAVSPERNRDKSVIGNWGLDENDVLWLLPDLYWESKSADESVDQIWQFGKQYGWFNFWGEKGIIERALRPFLIKRMMEESVYFNIDAFPTIGNKGARSISMRGRMAQGKVRFPKFAPWWAAAQDQILKFTGSGDDKEDDFCDMMAIMGEALLMQVRAGKATTSKSNVFPIGSIGWVKEASNREKMANQQRKAMGGF